MGFKIGFIGFGNMANAMVSGVLKSGIAKAQEIAIADPGKNAVDKAESLGVIVSDNLTVAKESQILVLSIKPNMLSIVAEEIKDTVSENTIILSIVAGQTLKGLAELFGENKKILLTMPNTPALVGEGITAYCAGQKMTKADKEACVEFLESFGKAAEVDEKWMPAVVAASGSSPAYIYMFIESLADAAVAMGMPRNLAYEFSAQAVLGSGKMVLESGLHPGALKDMVCSPGGTTIEAVRVLEEKGFRGTVMEGAMAAAKKNIEMQK